MLQPNILITLFNSHRMSYFRVEVLVNFWIMRQDLWSPKRLGMITVSLYNTPPNIEDRRYIVNIHVQSEHIFGET